MIMFTGSTATGQKVMAKAAETLTPVSLELGGKDPMIVLADADLERAANHAVYYSMFNAGQTCVEHRARLRRGARLRRLRGQGHREGAGAAQRVARPGPGTTDVGAMTFAPQVEIVERHVQRRGRQGRARRRRRRARARRPERHWFEPTVLVDVDHTMECMREETFGPTLPIMKVRRRRGGHPPGQRLALRPWRRRSSPRTSRAARRSPGASRPAPCASTTRSSTTRRSSCRWAASRPAASGRATAPTGSASSPSSRRCSCRGCTPRRDIHMYPYSAKMTGRLGKLVRLLYGRGKRD